jgi:SOS-response transcriptional repressor LexA
MNIIILDEQAERVYDYLVSYVSRYGYSPTIREIRDSNELSGWVASRVLNDLQKSGKITRVKGKPRTIHLNGYAMVPVNR